MYVITSFNIADQILVCAWRELCLTTLQTELFSLLSDFPTLNPTSPAGHKSEEELDLMTFKDKLEQQDQFTRCEITGQLGTPTIRPHVTASLKPVCGVLRMRRDDGFFHDLTICQSKNWLQFSRKIVPDHAVMEIESVNTLMREHHLLILGVANLLQPA